MNGEAFRSRLSEIRNNSHYLSCVLEKKNKLTYVKQNERLEIRKASTAGNEVMRLLPKEEEKLTPETNGGRG